MQLVNSTIDDVCQKEDTTPDAVLGMIERWLASEVEWAKLPPFTILGIDEIALKKGHRDFVVIVSARLPGTTTKPRPVPAESMIIRGRSRTPCRTGLVARTSGSSQAAIW